MSVHTYVACVDMGRFGAVAKTNSTLGNKLNFLLKLINIYCACFNNILILRAQIRRRTLAMGQDMPNNFFLRIHTILLFLKHKKAVDTLKSLKLVRLVKIFT